MGFDLSGMNPNITRPQPQLPESWNPKEWSDKDKKMHADYEEWQEENSGVYFRNNVWWWRPLWNFVTATCDDLLTEKDMESGTYNDGHKISKTKAGKIAKRLHSMIEDGKVKEYEDAFNKELNSLEQVDCDTCGATGRRNKPPEPGAGDYQECNGCNGTGKVDDWAK